MPRDSNGNYTLPAGNPVVSGTPISSTVQNSTMSDIASALTGSLSRSGLGGMLAPLPFSTGNVGSPGITWTNDPTSGFYLAAVGDMRAGIGGVASMRWTSSGVQIWSGTAWSSLLTQATLDAALLNYGNLGESETVLFDWTFQAGLTTPSIDSGSNPNITFAVGGIAKAVLASTGLSVTGTLGVTGVISQSGVAVALQSTTISGATSLAGGGDLSSNRSITLLNDVASPGTSFYYGTNSSGTKGYFPLSSVVGVPEAPIDGTTYGRNNASWIAVGGAGAFLPITGGTLTGPLTIASNSFPQSIISGTTVQDIYYDTDGTANQRRWGWKLNGTALQLETLDDTNTSTGVVMAFLRAAGVSSMQYGNATSLPTHTFHGLATFNQALTAGAGLTVTGAATISTTLGVTGAATLAATTHSGIAQFSNQLQCRSGNGVFFYNSTNTVNRTIAIDNTTFELLNGTKGGLWYWDSGQTLNRGGITITTVAPSGNDAAKAGNIVLVYE